MQSKASDTCTVLSMFLVNSHPKERNIKGKSVSQIFTDSKSTFLVSTRYCPGWGIGI